MRGCDVLKTLSHDLADAWLEYRISRITSSKVSKPGGWQKLVSLVAKRSERKIAKMERERGLR